MPNAEIALKDDSYWVCRDAALDTMGIVPQKDGGGYSFRISDAKADDLVHGGMGNTATGRTWSWTQLGALPPGSHDIKVVVAGSDGDWGAATLSDGWVVILAHATAKTTDVITSVAYTGADGRVVPYHSWRDAMGHEPVDVALTRTNSWLEFGRPVPVSFVTEDSPRGLWRSLGKRVGFTPSRVRISYPPPVD